MSYLVGTKEYPLRVAIIGAGPSGFYTAGELLQQKDHVVAVDMFERLPTPHGLVRYGVAPDHQKIKAVSKIFERTAANPNFRFFGNVTFGTDITVGDLKAHYDQIIYAVGAQSDRRLGIPGENLHGSLSATEFVAWYNGHPDYVDLTLDLDVEGAIVVGVGNVAMDVARILAKSVDELRATDIADYALASLAKSQVKNIYVLARRGPAQAKFTPPEFKEFGELPHADVIVDPTELDLDSASVAAVADDRQIQRNLGHLRDFAARPPRDSVRRVHFMFLRSPVEFVGEGGHVTAVRTEQNRLEQTASGYLNAVGTGHFEMLSAGLVLRAVGYRSVPLPDVPFDAGRGIIPNEEGRVQNAETAAPVSGQYVVGWAKRGPSGVIGTNKPDAAETVAHMLGDLSTITSAPVRDLASIEALLHARNVNIVTTADWRVLDAQEVATGKAQGRPRVKVTSVQGMLDSIAVARSA